MESHKIYYGSIVFILFEIVWLATQWISIEVLHPYNSSIGMEKKVTSQASIEWQWFGLVTTKNVILESEKQSHPSKWWELCFIYLKGIIVIFGNQILYFV